MIIDRPSFPVLKVLVAGGAIATGVIALRRWLLAKSDPRAVVKREGELPRETKLRTEAQVPWGVEV